MDQLIKITENGDLRVSFAYDETDQVAGRQTGDQTSTVNQYNGAGDLVSQIITDQSGTLVEKFNYTYDANGNLLSDGKRTFTYDAENRLLSVKEGNTTLVSYTDRADGMRKTMTTSSGTLTFHYDENKNVTHETNESGQVMGI